MWTRPVAVTIGVSLFCFLTNGSGQAATLEDVVARLERLERENTALRKQVIELKGDVVEKENAARREQIRTRRETAPAPRIEGQRSSAVVVREAYAAVPRSALAPYGATSVVAYNGLYLWSDGAYQTTNLPTFGLGVHALPGGPFGPDGGVSHKFDPKVIGYGIAGGFGYFLPDGNMPFVFGSNVRLEVGGSYVKAETAQSQAGIVAAGGLVGPVFLTGHNGAIFGSCGTGCTAVSHLQTDYTAWQANAKIASEVRWGPVTLTPSVTVFGGHSRVAQSFTQFVDSLIADYSAAIDVRWTDAGVKLGLHGNYELSPGLFFGLGGSLGVAGRWASLSATDMCSCLAGSIVGPHATAISDKEVTAAFLANTEASLTIRPTSDIMIKGLIGLNYDSRVPGLRTPSFDAYFFGSRNPAALQFSGEIGWYTGGGMTVLF